MRHNITFPILYLILTLFPFLEISAAVSESGIPSRQQTDGNVASSETHPLATRILVIGDSMTGWIADCMNAYGKTNGFEVSAVVWDGSTIKKWGANASKIKSFIAKEKPDAIFISLGLNELAERNPQTQLGSSLAKIKAAAGDIPVIWIGPPSWPGKTFGPTVNDWLKAQMGEGHYFSSLNLNLARQSKTNPHPSKQGIETWVNALMEWIPANAAIRLPGYRHPEGATMQRPKSFIYKRMKESL